MFKTAVAADSSKLSNDVTVENFDRWPLRNSGYSKQYEAFMIVIT